MVEFPKPLEKTLDRVARKWDIKPTDKSFMIHARAWKNPVSGRDGNAITIIEGEGPEAKVTSILETARWIVT